MMQKDLDVFQKARYLFLKPRYLFQKARHLFVGADYISPSQIRLFLLFRSSFHFNRNTRTINRLRMTGHPSSSFQPRLSSPFKICLQPLFSWFWWKKFYEWKEAERVVTRYPLTTKAPINRAFQQLMKGGRKKWISGSKENKRSWFLWIQSLYDKSFMKEAETDILNYKPHTIKKRIVSKRG